jgi:hypothetical protein
VNFSVLVKHPEAPASSDGSSDASRCFTCSVFVLSGMGPLLKWQWPKLEGRSGLFVAWVYLVYHL